MDRPASSIPTPLILASVDTDAIREQIHHELLDNLSEEPSNLSFSSELTRSRAIEIFEQDGFMQEAHIHALSLQPARSPDRRCGHAVPCDALNDFIHPRVHPSEADWEDARARAAQ
jgi:hypothetical protein